jgi:hypothetical protein
MPTRRYSALAPGLLLLMTAGCTTWQPIAGGASAFGPEPGLDVVRITSPDGSQVVLADPILRNDSIVGVSESRVCTRPPGAVADRCRRVRRPDGVPTVDLAAVDVRNTSAGATLGVIVGVPLAFLVIGLARWDHGS